MTNRISRFFADEETKSQAPAAPVFGPNLNEHFVIVPCAGGPAGCSPLHQVAYEAARRQVWEACLKSLER